VSVAIISNAFSLTLGFSPVFLGEKTKTVLTVFSTRASR
jgi:hypothetical protein